MKYLRNGTTYRGLDESTIYYAVINAFIKCIMTR